MASNIKVEDSAPKHEQQYQPILDLRKQLEVGLKYVQLQGTADVYTMGLSKEEGELSEANQEVSNFIFVKKTIGHGGFGILYEAEWKKEKESRRICLKTGLHKHRYESEEARVRGQQEVNRSILKEAEHYKKLSNYPHDNIVSMQFCCTSLDNNEVFLALDYCDGITLSQRLNRDRDKSLPMELLHKIMLECTLAVQHCISHGIVHCDIKPSNFIYAGMDKPLKLIDFGSAVTIDEGFDPSQANMDVAGTPEYMAPEILLNGLHSLNHDSDIYSLGALFFKAVTRRTPWSHHEETRVAWADKKRRAEVLEIIKGELCKSSEEPHEELKQTALQSILTDGNSAHFSRIPEQCNLICRMLSFHHSDRPSCEDILQMITVLNEDPILKVRHLNLAFPVKELDVQLEWTSCTMTYASGASRTFSYLRVHYSGAVVDEEDVGPFADIPGLRVLYSGAVVDEEDVGSLVDSLSPDLSVLYSEAVVDEEDVRPLADILSPDSDLVDVEQAEEICVSSPYIPGLPTVLDDISLSSDESNVSEEHYADYYSVMQSLPIPTYGIRDSLAQDVETPAENLDELSFDERQTNIDTEIESILNEVDAGHYVIMSHPDDDKKIYILGIHVERAIAEFEALTSKPEFLQYSITPSNMEEFHNGLPQYIKHLMPFTLEKHVLVGGTPEKIMNPSMPMGQLIVTASHVNNIPRTNGMRDPPLLPGFYGITVAHGFLIEWQTKRLFDSEEKESSIREEMLEANWNTRWSLRAADRNEIVQMDRAPICKYRQFYENCNEFLQDVAIFEISGNQLNEYGFRARDEHFDEETLHVLRTNFGQFIVGGYFPFTSQDDVCLLRGKRVIVASTDGTITKPPRQRTRCRVPPTKHLGLHLNFRTTSNNSLDEGCSGSMVYVVDKDGRHVYVAGMLVGYWKQIKQLSGVAIHQAVIIEPCLKELESGSYMKIRDIRPLRNILGDNRTAQELVGILQGSN